MAVKNKEITEGLFDKENLINAAPSLFKQPEEIVIGALHDIKAPITLAQAKQKVTEFLNKPIINQ